MDMHRQGAPALDSGDTAFVIISSILVLLMTLPGLMLFYGALTARGPCERTCARVRQRHEVAREAPPHRACVGALRVGRTGALPRARLPARSVVRR